MAPGEFSCPANAHVILHVLNLTRQTMFLRFTLPKGAYATVVLREVTKDAVSESESLAATKPDAEEPSAEEV